MRKILVLLVASIAIFLQSCVSTKPAVNSHSKANVVNLALVKEAQKNRFMFLDYGIRLNVADNRPNDNILRKYDASTTTTPKVNVEPDVRSFVDESMRHYMRTLGFNFDADIRTDYMMQVTITDYNVSYLSGVGWSGTVKMNIEVYDNNRILVYPNAPVTGRATRAGVSNDWELASVALNNAYANALADVDWDLIAFFLNKDNPNKQVTGDGTTGLEKNVIRWFVTSQPKGADVYWRVVSSTPDVKNTNRNYLGTTPYESTETLDIKGLKANNLGNVQIEVTCEKAGYLEQTKRFSLQQVVDQKEVSTKFNLVKEDE